MKSFFNHFFVAIGACASVLTMISFFFSIQWVNHPFLTWFLIFVILGGCVYYAHIQIYRKKEITVPISSFFKLKIQEGDLFNQEGIIVIPINNFFDTHVGNNIINQNSVPGQFINKYFKYRVIDLDKQIIDSLNLQKVTGEEIIGRNNGKNIKYPLGTCADIFVDSNHYVFVVTTEFDENNIPNLTRKDLSIVLNGLFYHLGTIKDDRTIHMPLIGAGYTRLDRRPERILHYIIDYFDFSLSDVRLFGNVQIDIRSLKDINLNRIENIFKNKHE
jgi:hypothetical protein